MFVAVFFLLVASANAATLGDAVEAFPVLEGLTTAPPALPADADLAAATANAVPLANSSGYLVSNGLLTGADGTGTDPATPIVQNGSLIGSSDGSFGAWVQASGNRAFILGASLPQSVQIQLVGRDSSAALVRHARGTFAAGAAPYGSDEFTTIAPSEIEELLLVRSPQDTVRFRYRISLMPEGARLEQVDGTVRVIGVDGTVLVVVSAPWAQDSAGTMYQPSLRVVDDSRFEMTLDTHTAQFPLLIDPVFRRGFEAQGHGDDYQAWWCGPKSNNTGDFYTGPGSDANPDVRSLCDDGISGAIKARTTGGWQISGSHDTGLSISAGSAMAKSTKGWIEIQDAQYPNTAPYTSLPSKQAAGIVESSFRGTIYDTSGATSCELTYSDNVTNGPLAGHADPTEGHRLWASHPWGGDDAETWATFPYSLTAPGTGNPLAAMGDGSAPQKHMVGMFAINAPTAGTQAEYIRLTIKAKQAISSTLAATGNIRCAATGLWTVNYNDNDPVRILDAPDLPDSRWYSPDRIVKIGKSSSFRKIDVEDWGSGIRSVRLIAGTKYKGPPRLGAPDTPKDRWRWNPCKNSVTYDNAGQVNSGEIHDNTPLYQETSVTNVSNRVTPCQNQVKGKMTPNVENPPRDLLDSDEGDTSAGPHYVQLSASDFVMKEASTAVADFGDALRPSRQQAGQSGWYWVDDTAPKCGQHPHDYNGGVEVLDAGTNGLAKVRVHIFDKGWDSTPQKGSGVQRVHVVISKRYGGQDIALDDTSIDDVDRQRGYIDFPNVDVWGLASIGGWVSSGINVKLSATLWDGTQLTANDNGGYLGECDSRVAYPYVDTIRPTCTDVPTRDPVSVVTFIHVVPGSVTGRVGSVKVYATDPLDATKPAPYAAGVASVQLVVNSGRVYFSSSSGTDALGDYWLFTGVDLLDGVDVPSGAQWDSFLSQARSTHLHAIVTDATRILNGDNPADHQAQCDRDINLLVDQTPPTCVDTPGNDLPGVATQPRGIHILDTDEDAHSTVRVFTNDAGWDGVPPAAAGTKVVRIKVNGQGWVEHDVTDAERVQGYVDFPNVDVYQGLTQDSVTVAGERYFTAAQTVQITAQVDDRTLLFAPASEQVQHRGECSMVWTTPGPPPEPSIEAVRGADEIQGVWPQVAAARGYIWRCERSNPQTPIVNETWFSASDSNRLEHVPAGQFNHGVAIPAGDYLSTGACAFSPDITINRDLKVFVRAEQFRIISAEAAATNTVDQRARVGSEATAEDTASGPFINSWWMSENGITRETYNGDPSTRDNFVLHVRDTDGDSDGDGLPDDLFSPSDPDERVLYSELQSGAVAPAGDHARIVVNIQDPTATEPLRSDLRAYLVIQLNSDPNQVLYRFFETDHPSEDLATRPMSASDPGVCVRGGGSGNVIVTRFWVLRCDRIPASFSAGTGAFTGWTRLEAPIHPREYDEFPLAPGERPPTSGVHNPAKPTPDRWSYYTGVAMRDRRQAADDQYLSFLGSTSADTPFTGTSGSYGSNLQRLIIDRVLPTISTTLQHVADQQHALVQVVLDDPAPSSASDPATLDASGLRDASIQLLDSDEHVLDSGPLDSSTCDPDFPKSPLVGGDRSGSSICLFALAAPSTVGIYRVRVHVRDMATNHAEKDEELVIPAAVSPTAVRGAGGVAAWWPQVYGGTSYVYTCSVDGVVDPTEHEAKHDSSGFWRTDLCVAGPGKRVDIVVTSVDAVGLRGPGTASAYAFVDQRPVIRLASEAAPGRLSRMGNYWESSFNGRAFGDPVHITDAIDEQTPDTIVEVTDPDHNLLTPIAPDPHMVDLPDRPSCITCANDFVRAVVAFRAQAGGTDPSSQAGDLPEAAHALIQLSNDPADQYVRLWDGTRDASAWDRTLDATDTDTCHPGEAGRVIHSQPNDMWSLDCGRVQFGAITDGMRVVLPIFPRDLGDSASPRFPTPDQVYDMQGLVKDQRQAADHRFLTNEIDSGPDVSPIYTDAKVTREPWLWVDRVLPNLLNSDVTQMGPPTGAKQHHLAMSVIDPSDSSTDPNQLFASGIYTAHVSGGRVDPTTNQVVNNVVNGDATCTPAPNLSYQLSLHCEIDTTNLTATGLYRYTVTLTDYVGNHRGFVIEKRYYAPPLPPLLGYQHAAYGSGVFWQQTVDATGYLWDCRLGSATGALIASGSATATQPVGTWRTEVCHVPPSTTVYTTVTAFGPGGLSDPVTTAHVTDARPTLTTLDTPTTRYDTQNGSVYANGTTNRDLVIRARDMNISINSSLDPMVQWTGIGERPSNFALDDRYARSVVVVTPPSGRPSDSKAFIISQYSTDVAGARLVKIVDATFADDLATTPILIGDDASDAATCHPGQAKTISAATWTINCADLDYVVEDVTQTQLTLPIRPTNLTPDQEYTVTGWVRESRQPVDNRYLSSDTSAGPDQSFANAQQEALGKLIVDRVLPVGSPNAPTTTSGPIDLKVDAAHDVIPGVSTTPVQFDATGLSRVTVQIAGPSGSIELPETNMTCTSSLPRTQDAASDCTYTFTPTAGGSYTVTFEVYDVAGNHGTYIRTFDYATVPPPSAPASLLSSRGARGVGVFWSPVAGATGYTWECRKQSNGSLVASGSAVPSGVPPRWRTALCPGAPGEPLVFTVRSVGPGGTSPTAATKTDFVDYRPAIAADTDPDGSTTRYDTDNGTQYANGTTNRDIRFRVTDTSTGLETPPGSSADFTGIPERPTPLMTADETARSVIAIRPPASRSSDTTAYLVVQFNGTNPANVRRATLLDNSFAGDLATFSFDSVPYCNLTTGAPGLLQTTYWTLNCTDISYVLAAYADIRVSLPIRPKAATPDQTYSVSGWVRDQRQHLDNRYLSSDGSSTYDQPYSMATTTDLGTLVIDRVRPAGAFSLSELTANATQISVDTARDVLPASFDATGLAKAEVTVVAPDSQVLAASQAMTCSPVLPRTTDTSSNCTYTLVSTQAGVHQVTVRLTDAAGNHVELPGTYDHAPQIAPTQAPDITVIRASNGVVAKWAPIAGATGYRWTCTNTNGSVTTTQTGTTFFNSPNGPIVHTPVCNANLANTSEKTISVQVQALNGSLEGPWSTVKSAVADRTPIASVNYAPHNLASPNDTSVFTLNTTDTSGEFNSLSAPDLDLTSIQDPAPASDRARMVFHLNAPRGQSSYSLHAIVQMGPNDGNRLIQFVTGPAPTGAISGAALNDADTDTCAPGSTEVYESSYWRIDCANVTMTITATSAIVTLPIQLRVDTNGTYLSRDGNYAQSLEVRDVRQIGDNKYLQFSSPSSAHYIDHIRPTGTLTVTQTGTASAPAASLQIHANDITPTPSTNPTGIEETYLRTLAIKTEKLIGGSYQLVSDFQDVTNAQCNGSIGGAHSRDCTVPKTGLESATTYRFTLRVEDRGQNTYLVTPVEYTTSTPPGQAGVLDQSYGTNGYAITDFGSLSGTVSASAQLTNHNTLTVGTRSDKAILMTSHTPTGASSTSFGTNGVAAYTNTILQKAAGTTIDSSGRILVAADVYVQFRERVAVFRFLADGTLDTTFGSNGYTIVIPVTDSAAHASDVEIDSQGRIVIAGTLQTFTNEQRFFASRLSSSGTMDTSFGTSGSASSTYPDAYTVTGGYIAFRSNDSVLVAGNTYFTTPPSSSDRNATVVAFTTNGALDTTFGGGDGWFLSKPEGNAVTVRNITFEGDGKATLGLACESGCGFGIARITANGELDTTYGSNDDGSTFVNVSGTWTEDYDMVPTPDGLYVVVGRSGTTANSTPNLAIARFDGDGTIDTGFGTNGYTITDVPQGDLETMSATQAPTGNIIIAGTLTPPTGTKQYLLASYFA